MAIHKKEIESENRRREAERAEVEQLLMIEEEIRDAMKRGRIDKIYNQGPTSARKIELQELDKTNFLEKVPIIIKKEP